MCRLRVCDECWSTSGDKERILGRLTEATSGSAKVTRSDCLDACERDGVVVVTPSRRGREAGGRPSWFLGILSPSAVDDIATFVVDGGPGLAEPGELLRLPETSAGATP